MSAGLFAAGAPDPARQPLAARMRPGNLDEFVGQEHLLAPGLPLRAEIEGGTLGSVVFWAPPGCGKTTLARIVASCSDAVFEPRSAVTCGVAEVRRIGEAAKERAAMYGRRTLLFLDEVHHFSRTQQDSLLEFLEEGTLTMLGATTENPYLALSGALLSRARVVELRPLSPADVSQVLARALAEPVRGLGARRLRLEPDAAEYLAQASAGDARWALNALEGASHMVADGGALTLALCEQAAARPALRYDRAGDGRFDTVSAFIKSVRASDADAALHYLARMLEAGEDARYVARRLVVLASEDVGNADPQALLVATAAMQAALHVGMPEARIVLAQATTYLSEAPKSNRSYVAVERALADVRDGKAGPVPLHLRNAPHPGLRAYGRGEGYAYPHDFDDAFAGQGCLPEGDLSTPYYEPSDQGFEAGIAALRASRGRGRGTTHR